MQFGGQTQLLPRETSVVIIDYSSFSIQIQYYKMISRYSSLENCISTCQHSLFDSVVEGRMLVLSYPLLTVPRWVQTHPQCYLSILTDLEDLGLHLVHCLKRQPLALVKQLALFWQDLQINMNKFHIHSKILGSFSIAYKTKALSVRLPLGRIFGE